MKNLKQILTIALVAAVLLIAAANPAFAAGNVPAMCPAMCKEAGSSAILKNTNPFTSAEAIATKKRIELLEDYLSQYNSPLADSAETFVLTAQKYNLDWRLLPAISGIESTFGKRIAYGTHNPFGWGRGYITFVNWDAAIEEVGKKLRKNYMDRWNAKTVAQIAPIYAPPSKTWARNVTYFMSDIEDFEKNHSLLALNLSL